MESRVIKLIGERLSQVTMKVTANLWTILQTHLNTGIIDFVEAQRVAESPCMFVSYRGDGYLFIFTIHMVTQ